ncbi:MAG: O-antigen polymerase [Candidatus Marinimicrobia bacterium]|jgi:oligosaccharide repeat unit polymerase|nr:O-antigen polymerase [Candidatus Neomarinimicrobiota bacterium]|tara:strand:+ start:655 stop:2100 length:1446 start_codon:yes stop_codon:yes gene_type:complete
MDRAEIIGIDHYDWNIDRALIFIIPIVLLAVLIWIPEEELIQSSLLCIAIFFSVLLTYKHRLVYGFSGIRIASIPSIIITTFTVFIAIPSIYILAINEHPNEIPYFFSIAMFYLLFPAGLLFGNKFRQIDIPRVIELLTQKYSKHIFDKYFYEILVILLSISILIFCGYILRVSEIPLVELIKNPGNSAKFYFMREEALKILEMTKIERYLFHWLRSLFIPFGIIGSLILNSIYRKRKFKILLILFFIFGLIVNTITLEKSPIAIIFLSIAVYLFLRREKITPSLIVTLVLITLAGPITITYFLYIDRQEVFNVIFWSYINRLFVTPAAVLFYYFKHFPETHDFLLGRSSQLFSWIHFEGTFPISNYVAQLYWDDPSTTGFANANYLGNFWSDFGWYGTTISTFIFGIIAHLFQWKILQTTHYRKNLLYLVVMSICVPTFTFGFFSSNITILFFTRGLLLLIIFLFGYDYWQKRTMINVMK